MCRQNILYIGKKRRVQDAEDLGVLVHESQKTSMQVQQIIKKVNGMLAFIAKGIEYKGKEVLLQLHKALVRPHLEYCAQFWSPYLRKDVVALEAVQRRFTRLIPEVRGLSYEERLNSLGRHSLEFTRMRRDQIEVYKMIKDMDKVDVERMLPLVGHCRTRSHSLRIRGSKFKIELRRNYFSQRVVNLWNLLPLSVVDAGTLSKFKEELDFLVVMG